MMEKPLSGDVLPALSFTVTENPCEYRNPGAVTSVSVAASGVPLIIPVAGLSDKPLGR